MERTAKCQCGGFSVTVSGEPDFVNVCHCQDCQRRSGVPWTSNACFQKPNVRLEGAYKTYSRAGQEGRYLHNHFCPDCGSTVGWTADLIPDQFGVAVGAFNDPTFPGPSVSIWEQAMYAWVPRIPDVAHFTQGRPRPPAS